MVVVVETVQGDFMVGKDGDDTVTHLRMSDGYINASELCQAAQKSLGNYFCRKRTHVYLNGLSECLRIPGEELVRKEHDGNTWVHLHVGMHLAAWCSPRLQVIVNSLLTRYWSSLPPSR
jgi:hypothetical protein